MSKLAMLLSLIAALSGTPLRQAEAADDLSRSLVGEVLATELIAPDGGVGDDSGETIRIGTPSSLSIELSPFSDFSLLEPPRNLSWPTPGTAKPLEKRCAWPLRPSILRQAWLQVFLF